MTPTVCLNDKKLSQTYFKSEQDFNAATQLLPSMILAQISAPTPNWGQPPSTVTRWLVFITLVSILSTSIGRMVRRLITWHKDRQEVVQQAAERRSSVSVNNNRCVPSSTSHSIPSLARTAAASRQWPTYREWLTKVTLVPETQTGEEEEERFRVTTVTQSDLWHPRLLYRHILTDLTPPFPPQISRLYPTTKLIFYFFGKPSESHFFLYKTLLVKVNS